MRRRTALAFTLLGLAALLALLIAVRVPATQAQGPGAGRAVAQDVVPAAASYNGQPGYELPAMTTTYAYANLPYVARGEVDTTIFVQNPLGEEANFVVYFFEPDGWMPGFVMDTIPPHGTAEIELVGIPWLPTGYEGSAVVESDAPIAAVTNAGPDEGGSLLSYNGIVLPAVGDTAEAVTPDIKRNYQDWNTSLWVQNTSGELADVTITYMPYGVGNLLVVADTIPAWASHVYHQADMPALGDTFFGSAYVEADQPVAVVVEAWNAAGAEAFAYPGTVLEDADTVVLAPRQQKAAGGWTSSVMLMNVGPDNATVDAGWHAADGAWQLTVTNIVSPGLAVEHDLAALSGLPGGFDGSLVGAADQLIVGLARSLTLYTAGDAAAASPTQGLGQVQLAAPPYEVHLPRVAHVVAAELSTELSIQNASDTGAEATVTITFYHHSGTATAIVEDTIPYKGVARYKTGEVSALGENWTGAATVHATQPVAVEVTQLVGPAGVNVLVVTTNEDSGAGSLRQVLAQAGINDMITFDPSAFPPGDPATIALLSPLPEIVTDGLTIDGSGASVILDGTGAGETDGLRITADGVTVRQLQITGFEQDGIDVRLGSEGTSIEGNVIGGNGHHGIRIQGDGISGTRIVGNHLGTDATGTAANGNGFSGLSVKEGPVDTLVQENVIGANDDHGITITGPASDCLVTSNYIGTDPGGLLDLGNKLHGIIIRDGAQDNVVGPDNRIAYNGRSGVRVEGAGTLRNTITLNSITDNGKYGIDNVEGGNGEIAPPLILTVTETTVLGQAQPGDAVEVFSDPFFEGDTFLGGTVAGASGGFTVPLATPLAKPLVTATGTDTEGNTSEFGAFCVPETIEAPGKLWPYCGAEPSPLSSPFGARLMASQDYRYDFHRGVDLPAPLETPFYSIAAGVVTRVENDPLDLDGTIRIRHTDPVTYYSHYRHVAQTYVITGQVVHQGMLIGSTGKSYSEFEHIHFEIRDEPGTYEKYAENPFGAMPYDDSNEYQITLDQVSIDPADPVSPTTVLMTVVAPRQELDLDRFAVSIDGEERAIGFNELNRTKTPAPNNTEPDVLDNPYQDGVCILPQRFNAASDAYRISLAFDRMPGATPHTVVASATDLFSYTVTAETAIDASTPLLSPAVVTATTPAGHWVSHIHTLTNGSAVTRAFTLTARSAQSWTVVIEPETVFLEAGESVTVTSYISVPDNEYVVPGTIDCVVVEVEGSPGAPPKRVYLPIVHKSP
jgi:murein DD-endopeptidase MepM/ murein hydrolase activator NlpD